MATVPQALTKLHQLDVFGSRLIVEYATPVKSSQESVEDRSSMQHCNACVCYGRSNAVEYIVIMPCQAVELMTMPSSRTNDHAKQ